MLRILKDTKIDFLRMRKGAFIISGIMILGGLFSIYQIMSGKANTGIDFSGGTMLYLRLDSELPVSEIRRALRPIGFEDATIQRVRGEESPRFMVRTRNKQFKTGEVADNLLSTLRKELPRSKITLEGSEEIGPAVSRKLQRDAGRSVLIAIVFIIIYITIRFDFKFGVAAALATLHDGLAVLAVTQFSGIEFNLLIITAVLTVLGYSLTDTVVVYDRIRENLRRYRDDDMPKIINRSINEVLSRTIITSLTTMLVVVCLLVLGGAILYGFAFALLVGVIIGSYSSIFVASPIIVEWERWTSGR